MSTDVTRDFAFGLPKAELHLHLEGTLEPDLKLSLARKNGVDIGQSTVEEVQATYQFNDLRPTPRAAFRLRRSFAATTAPSSRRASRAFRRPDPVFPVRCERAGCPRDAAGWLPYKDMFIGVGLDSDERDNPPTKFAEVFALAREAGLHVTMHCDIDQVGSIDNIRAALIELGAERLDHGTNIVEDPELVAYARDHGIGLTSCPLSNSFVTEEMKGKEIVELTAAGVKVSVNSDDPAYFGGYVGDNYLALAQRFGLGRADLERIARNSIEIAWISDDEKAELLERVDRFVSEN